MIPAPPDPTTDRELAERVRGARDAAAFRELYRRHTPALFAVASRLVDGAADAEDVVHDAWIRAIDGLPRFEWRSTLRSWLTGIVVNRARELGRRERKLRTIDDAWPDHGARNASDALDVVDLERAIAALPPGYREVLVLHDVEGFTHEEIGELLGIASGTSKSQLARARERMRRVLEPTRREGT